MPKPVMRPPSYVDRATGAAELCIDPSTWDQWVREGLLPPPIRIGKKAGKAGKKPLWRWADIDACLQGHAPVVQMPEPEPFFRGLADGTEAQRGRCGAA